VTGGTDDVVLVGDIGGERAVLDGRGVKIQRQDTISVVADTVDVVEEEEVCLGGEVPSTPPFPLTLSTFEPVSSDGGSMSAISSSIGSQ
jgi:hypothetical protein